jgi:hypothetical protein
MLFNSKLLRCCYLFYMPEVLQPLAHNYKQWQEQVAGVQVPISEGNLLVKA